MTPTLDFVPVKIDPGACLYVPQQLAKTTPYPGGTRFNRCHLRPVVCYSISAMYPWISHLGQVAADRVVDVTVGGAVTVLAGWFRNRRGSQPSQSTGSKKTFFELAS